MKVTRIEADKQRLNSQLEQMLASYKQLEVSHSELMKGQSQYEDWKQKSVADEVRLASLQEQINKLQESNRGLISGNTALQNDLEKMQLELKASKAGETADFERDPNQESLSVDDLHRSKNAASKKKGKDSESPSSKKEKRFLFNELK